MSIILRREQDMFDSKKTFNDNLMDDLDEDIDDILLENINVAFTLNDIYDFLQQKYPDRYTQKYDRFYSNKIYQILNTKDISKVKKNNKNRYIFISDSKKNDNNMDVNESNISIHHNYNNYNMNSIYYILCLSALLYYIVYCR